MHENSWKCVCCVMAENDDVAASYGELISFNILGDVIAESMMKDESLMVGNEMKVGCRLMMKLMQCWNVLLYLHKSCC